jgi:hypothetical protein
MAGHGRKPSPTGDGAFDRMMRFGSALFAVKKDELPKRDQRKKAPRKKHTAKGTTAPE